LTNARHPARRTEPIRDADQGTEQIGDDVAHSKQPSGMSKPSTRHKCRYRSGVHVAWQLWHVQPTAATICNAACRTTSPAESLRHTHRASHAGHGALMRLML